MDIFRIDYSGYIIIDKNDMVVRRIDLQSGEFVLVNVKNIETKTLLEGIQKGDFYVDLGECTKQALDGEESFDVYIEETINDIDAQNREINKKR